MAWSECSGWVVEADGSCAVDELQGRPVTPLTCSSCQRTIRSCGVMWSTHPQSPLEPTGPTRSCLVAPAAGQLSATRCPAGPIYLRPHRSANSVRNGGRHGEKSGVRRRRRVRWRPSVARTYTRTRERRGDGVRGHCLHRFGDRRRDGHGLVNLRALPPARLSCLRNPLRRGRLR